MKIELTQDYSELLLDMNTPCISFPHYRHTNEQTKLSLQTSFKMYNHFLDDEIINQLNLNKTKLELTDMLNSNLVIAFLTKECINTIFRPMLACTLSDWCIAPSHTKRDCRIGANGVERMKRRHHCSRPSDSLFSVLAGKMFGFDFDRYTVGLGRPSLASVRNLD